MTFGTTLLGVVIVWLACGFGCAAIAKSKNKSVFRWFWLGLLLGIFGLLIIVIVNPEVDTKDRIDKLKANGEADALAELIANETDMYICRLAAESLMELGDERGKEILDSPIGEALATTPTYGLGLRLLTTIGVAIVSYIVSFVLAFNLSFLWWETSGLVFESIMLFVLTILIPGYIAYRWGWRNKRFEDA